VIAVDGGDDPDATVRLPRTIRIRTDEPGTAATGRPGLRPRRPQHRRRRGLGPSTRARRPRPPDAAPGSSAGRSTGRAQARRRRGHGRDARDGGRLGARLIIDRAYLVGVADEEIVIYRGFDVQLGPSTCCACTSAPGVTLDQVQPALRPVYEAGRPAADLGDARRIVRNIPLVEGAAG
jgi:hypothetical protein